VLHERGDIAGAEAAFVRADQRGHGGGAFNLGLVLEARGDLAGARAALLRAHERGEPGADDALAALLRP
jgi:Flp pilus assembly protein TadD